MQQKYARMVGIVAGAVGLIAVGAMPAKAGEASVEVLGVQLVPTVLKARMSGAEEVPGPGDEDGRGVFVGVVRGDQLCYTITAVRIETPTAAHIHEAPRGVAGDIVVGLVPPVNRIARDCISAVPDDQAEPMEMSESELAAIVADPAAFYVNVHNADFPAGAIRGQLED